MAGPNMQVFCSSGQFLQPDLTFPSKTEITSFALPENVKFDWENFLRTHTNFIWRNVRKEDKVEQDWTPEQCQLPKSPSGVDYPDPRAETLSFPELPPGQHRPSHTGYTLGCLPSSVNNIKLFIVAETYVKSAWVIGSGKFFPCEHLWERSRTLHTKLDD